MKKYAEEGRKFDAIIIDCTDVWLDEAVASTLFTPEFYGNIYMILNNGAGFSQQVSDETIVQKFKTLVRAGGFEDEKVVI